MTSFTEPDVSIIFMDEDETHGSCEGQLCEERIIDVQLCRHCAHCVDETLTNLFYDEVPDYEFEGGAYGALHVRTSFRPNQ